MNALKAVCVVFQPLIITTKNLRKLMNVYANR